MEWEQDKPGPSARGYSLLREGKLIGRVDVGRSPAMDSSDVRSDTATHSETEWGHAPVINQRTTRVQEINSKRQTAELLNAAQDPKRNLSDVIMGTSWDAAVWPEGALPQTVGRFAELQAAMKAVEKWWAHWNRDDQ